jgi:hypothetical protein
MLRLHWWPGPACTKHFDGLTIGQPCSLPQQALENAPPGRQGGEKHEKVGPVLTTAALSAATASIAT